MLSLKISSSTHGAIKEIPRSHSVYFRIEVDWIYHVPLEKVHTRSMAVSFRKETSLEQARGWAHGVVSGNPKEPAQWKDLDQLSIECRTRNGKWLVSNLSEESILGIPPSGISEI